MNSEIVIDNLGSCDFLNDINIYDKDSYQSIYQAPELVTLDSEIGPWTDIYAIGKIIIELISSKAESGDYFEGLKTINDNQTINKYHEAIEKSISFYSKDRIKDASEMKKMLYPDISKKNIYLSSRAFAAVIALLAFISSAYVLSMDKNITSYDLIASNENIVIEEEETPLGPVKILPGSSGDVLNGFKFVTEPFEVINLNKNMFVKWNISNDTKMKSIEVDNLSFMLNDKQKSFDLSNLDLKTDDYTLTINYEYDGELTKKKIIISIEE